ncbi:MAG TPA: LuxR C-terminal-related transcriptional regulator [Stellaceae bacterium]|nr:LuxR C-terminal-related transcriptional regulator [Stellaceae bacterium]
MGNGVRSDGELRVRQRQEIVRLAHAGHDLPMLLDETVRILRKAIPCEAGCWHALDPATLLETSYRAVNLPIENPLAAEIEYLHEDYNQFATLARAPTHSGILSVVTGGVPERSLRYRELIRPFGLDGELRAAFVNDGTAWGSVCLLRDRYSRDFTAEEASLLEEISEHIGRGIRTALLLEAASANVNEAGGPGLILLDERQRLDAMTLPAERLLQELADGSMEKPAERVLPYVVHAVAAKARLAGRADGAGAPARAHLRTRSGEWLVLHGCIIASEAQKRIAVIVERAAPPGLAPAIAETYGLTRREGEVMRHLVQGFSTKQIAAALRISPYTVQEHFTAIFDKVGVRSRRQLVGKLFCQLYEPRIRQQRPFGLSDWFPAAVTSRTDRLKN